MPDQTAAQEHWIHVPIMVAAESAEDAAELVRDALMSKSFDQTGDLDNCILMWDLPGDVDKEAK